MSTYNPTGGTYRTNSGVYTRDSDLAERFFIDDFEDQSFSPYENRYPNYGDITRDAAYTGKYGFEGIMGESILNWSFPGDGLDFYPGPGDEWCHLVNWQEVTDGQQYHSFIRFGGNDKSDKWMPRHNFYLTQRGHAKLSLHTRDEYYVCVEDKSAFDPNILLDTWHVILIKWHDATKDGRTGFRIMLFEAAGFPFVSWNMSDFDDGIITPTPIFELDTDDNAETDGSDGKMPQEQGAIGHAETSYIKHYHDDIELLVRQ